MSIVISGPVAFLSVSKSAVYFSKSFATDSKAFDAKHAKGTATPVKKMQSDLEVAYWGEDNRFPQNIEQQLSYCGIAKAGLDFKARTLFGNGIIPGKVAGYEDEGKKEIFVPLTGDKYKPVFNAVNDRRIYRFFLEYLQDWTTYSNCFPEVILSKDAKTITGFVHQESCDSRFKQMNTKGEFDTVYLSKLWGVGSDQYVKFDPNKKLPFVIKNPDKIREIDNIYVKALDCIDVYNSVESLREIAQKQRDSKGLSGFKSAILPVNYPSTNKTYYQVPAWDGARLAGWLEIACKIPAMIKTLYQKAFSIKYHIEVPETYFHQKYGVEVWEGKSDTKKEEAKKELLQQMEDYLTGAENAYKTFVSFFSVDHREHKEYGRIKITEIQDTTTLDKELLTGSAAEMQILISMGIRPTLFGAGSIGTGQQRSGGSDLRESYLVYLASLHLERQVLLEPLYLMRDYNRLVGEQDEWEEDIVFRFRDTVLTTLDTGAGTTKKIG